MFSPLLSGFQNITNVLRSKPPSNNVSTEGRKRRQRNIKKTSSGVRNEAGRIEEVPKEAVGRRLLESSGTAHPQPMPSQKCRRSKPLTYRSRFARSPKTIGSTNHCCIAARAHEVRNEEEKSFSWLHDRKRPRAEGGVRKREPKPQDEEQKRRGKGRTGGDVGKQGQEVLCGEARVPEKRAFLGHAKRRQAGVNPSTRATVSGTPKRVMVTRLEAGRRAWRASRSDPSRRAWARGARESRADGGGAASDPIGPVTGGCRSNGMQA